MRGEGDLRRETVIDCHERDALVEQGEERRRDEFLAPGIKAAAMDEDDERRGLVRFRLPKIQHVPLVRAVVFVGFVRGGLR